MSIITLGTGSILIIILQIIIFTYINKVTKACNPMPVEPISHGPELKYNFKKT